MLETFFLGVSAALWVVDGLENRDYWAAAAGLAALAAVAVSLIF